MTGNRTRRVCQADNCEQMVTPPRTKYHSDRCMRRSNMQKYRAKKRSIDNDNLRVLRQTGDHWYDEYVGRYAHDVKQGMKMTDVAKLMGTTPGFISKLHARWLAEQDVERKAEGWEPPEPFSDDPVEDFCLFRAEHFRTPDGKPYHTPGFARKWVAGVYKAFEEGGCLIVLSPPRHGKTELFTHFCVWLVIRYPNIRIIYIGGSAELAEQSVEMVKDHLESNETLLRYVAPGKHFRPQIKSGRTWTKQRFTSATRTITGIKSPTMVAVGRGGKLPSRDADIIIVDDPEDHDSTLHPGTREDTRGWWAKSVMSRKEAHTCVFVIGSRVHPDDLTGYLLRAPAFESIVEQAHDPTCNEPADEPDRHINCMLWPEIRSYSWLMEKKNDPLQALFFEMVYQNQAVDNDLAHFRPEDIDACYDPTRKLGDIPKGTRLIAGLDPSVSGYQAAFLWAVDVITGRRYMVDIDNRLGGGIGPALEIMQRWYVEYRCSYWVVEENLYHGAINADEKIRKWAGKNYVVIEGHETYGNKWDRHFGVSSLSRYFTNEIELENGQEVRLVSLPTGDEAGRAKVNDYRRGLINFNRDAQALDRGSRRRVKTSDIVMASWFPEETIRRWEREEGEVEITYTQTSYPFTGMDLAASVWG